MPVNFTDQEWKDYLDKLWYIKPFTDKEWEEYERLLQLGTKNPNYNFYPNPRIPMHYPIPESPEPQKSPQKPVFIKSLEQKELANTHPSHVKELCFFVGIFIIIYIICLSLLL